MANPILVTGAAGRVGAVGRTVTELLLTQGKAVRALVRTEDERAQALRHLGAEVVVGNLLDLDSMHRAIAGVETMYFGMSVSDAYLAATVNAAAVAKHHGVKAFINMSQMTVSQMSITETTLSPQHKLHWLAEQALNWSGLPVVHVRPTVFLEGFFLTLTSDSVMESDQIRLPFGEGKTAPVAAEDVARVIAALLVNPAPHIGKIYHLTGPQSENMHFYAKEYSKALGRTITYQDIPVEPWRNEVLKRGWPVHVVNHLATLSDLHRAGRFDRMSDDVLTLTRQESLSVQEFVRKNAASFTAAVTAKEARVLFSKQTQVFASRLDVGPYALVQHKKQKYRRAIPAHKRVSFANFHSGAFLSKVKKREARLFFPFLAKLCASSAGFSCEGSALRSDETHNRDLDSVDGQSPRANCSIPTPY